MSSKYRHRNGAVARDGYVDYKNNSPTKTNAFVYSNEEQQYSFNKPQVTQYNYDNDPNAANGYEQPRPSYQDFHSAHLIQNDNRYHNNNMVLNIPTTKSRDSSRHRRKNRDQYEPELKSMEINSQKRQSRMPDWMHLNGKHVGHSQISSKDMRQQKPDEFWRPDQFNRSPDHEEQFNQRRGSQKKPSNKSSSDSKSRDTKARSKSKERRNNSNRNVTNEREFQSLAFFDFDIDHQQPPLLTSERKKAKDKRSGNAYKVADYNQETSNGHLDMRQSNRGRQDISKQLFHNARYPLNEPRSLNYPGQNTFHSPTNWILGQQMHNYPFAQQQQSTNRRQIPHENKTKYKAVNGNINGSPPYGVMSFGQRGGYNSGGTSGSGSSSQDVQKSPASRTSSKISYDSTGPNDERYYVTPNDNMNHPKSYRSPERKTKYKQKTEKVIEMTVPLNDLVAMHQSNVQDAYKENHEKRKRVKSKNKENATSILEANRYLFSTKSNELVSINNRSENKSIKELRTKEPYQSDKYKLRETPKSSRKDLPNTNNNHISAKHKDLSKSSPHLGNTLVGSPHKRRNIKIQTDKYQRSCDKIIDQKIKDIDDTESGIDIPEPDYSPILIRRSESPAFEHGELSPVRNKETVQHCKTNNDTKGSNPSSPTVWENATRYRGSLEEVLVDDEDILNSPDMSKPTKDGNVRNYVQENSYGSSTNVNKSLPQVVTQNHINVADESQQPISINYNSNPTRSEEEAILGLEKALVGRTRVKGMVEKIRKETERDKIRQELRRSAFLVSQCQTNESNPTSLNLPLPTRKVSCSGSSDGMSDGGEGNHYKQHSTEDGDLVIEDLEIYGNPVDDYDDKDKEGLDIYKDLISVALEQEKLEDMKQKRAQSNGMQPRAQQNRNKTIEAASLHGNRSNNASELSLKGSQSPKYSSKSKRRLKKENSGSNSGRMNGYEQNRSRPNSASYKTRDDSLSPERSNLSATSNGNYALSYSQDILTERREMHPQSIMRSQPNINMYTNPEISSYPNGSRKFPDDDDNGIFNSSNEENNVHSRQSHFFNSLFPSRANRFGYPVYPQRHFGIPTPQASGPVSFAGFSPELRNKTFYDPDLDAQESESPSLLTDVGHHSNIYSSTSTSILSSVPKIFKSSSSKNKKNKKNGKRGFFSFFH